MLGGSGENAAHARAAVLQAANEIERFIGGDAAADDEKDARVPSALIVARSAPLRCRRLEMLQHVAACLVGRILEDDAHLVLHRPAVSCRAQPQPRLEPVVELADGEAGHQISLFFQWLAQG